MEVSESSVKRWCDRGDIPAETTPGGHRRIPITGLLEFLKGSGRSLVRPDLLGLALSSQPGPRATRKVARQFREALLIGNESRVEAALIDAHLSGHSASELGDKIISPTFSEIGELWECGDAEVYQERHACELATRAIDQVRQLTSVPTSGPTAIGGTVEGDYYGLATILVELVLRNAGWKASSIGCNLPFETMAAAIERRQPKLYWISASHIADDDAFVAGLGQLCGQFGAATEFVLGGRMVSDAIRRRLPNVRVFERLEELESFAKQRREALTPGEAKD